MSNLLPILKNRQEFEVQKGRGMFVDELFKNEHSPIVMYGLDKGDYLEYAQSKGESEDRQIKEQAIKNLESLDVLVEVQEMQGFKLVLVQHEYAAEKILDKTFMKKVADELGSDSIVAGIPMKGFMAAVAKGKGEENLYGAVVKQYKNAQTYPISDSLYYLVDGEIGMIGGNQSGAIQNENGLLEVSGRNDEKGKVGFIAKVGNKSEDELANQIQIVFQNILLQGIRDSKNFNGKIDFHISPRFNQLTSGLGERIKRMARNISERGASQLMGGLSGEEFKVRFFYGDDTLIAETVQTDPDQLTNKANDPKPDPERQRNEPANQSTSEKRPWWKFW